MGKYSKLIPEDFRELIDKSTEGYMIASGNGDILYTNEAYEEACAPTGERMLGHNIKEYIERGVIKRSSLLTAIEQRKKISLSLIRNDREVIVTSTPIMDKNGNVVKVLTQAKDSTEQESLRKQLDIMAEMMSAANISGNEGYHYEYGPNCIVVSQNMKQVFELAKRIKDFNTTVILRGESGVGKDVIAQYIHQQSTRKDKPYVVINCSALAENLLETELFGYAGGTFTGGNKEGKKGLFEATENGTLFLDEIGDISPNLQVKLLRAIETKSITRVGDYKTIPINVRIVTATNKNLEKMVFDGVFREDLYYRLNVVSIDIPPLRDRKDDIIPLSLYFLKTFNKLYSTNKKMSKEIQNMLKGYKWPGNVRELKNLIERLIVTSNKDTLYPSDVTFKKKEYINGQEPINPSDLPATITLNKLVPIEEIVACAEKELLLKARRELGSSRRIADALKIDHATVCRKLKKYNITI